MKLTKHERRQRRLAQLRADQAETLAQIPEQQQPPLQIGRRPDAPVDPVRLELLLRRRAEDALTGDARAFLRARRIRAEAREASQLMQASNSIANIEHYIGLLTDGVERPKHTDEIESSLGDFAILVRLADLQASLTGIVVPPADLSS